MSRTIAISMLVLLMVSSAASAPVVLWVEDGTPTAYRAARDALEASGAVPRHCYPPHFLAGDLEWSHLEDLPAGVRLLARADDDAAKAAVPADAARFLEAWRRLPAAKAEPGPVLDLPPPPDDVLRHEDLPLGAEKIPHGALDSDTSLYMIGDVSVIVVLPESDATSPDTEDWTPEEIAAVHAEILAGLDWWAAIEPAAHLSFVHHWHDQVSIPKEPIAMDGIDYWILDVMEALGYPFSGSWVEDIEACVNDHRDADGTDWGFMAFVADSSDDPDGQFADGRFAFSILNGDGGGPMLGMTYDNQNYTIDHMDAVLAHEVGHIFGAGDQYGGCGCTDDLGYLNYENQNCVNACALAEDSIMKTVVAPFTGGLVDAYARGQLGLVDTDADGILDIVDTTPSLALDPPVSSVPLRYVLNGEAHVNALPTANEWYSTATINTIAAVEYRLDGGPWLDATATDGAFDSPGESFLIDVSVSGGTIHLLEARSVNSEGNASAISSEFLDGVSQVPQARGLSLAAHPNPFNPRTELRYRLPEPGVVRLEIHDLAGRLVRRLADGPREAGEHVAAWDGTDDRGRAVPSGHYRARLVSGDGTVVAKLSLVR